MKNKNVCNSEKALYGRIKIILIIKKIIIIKIFLYKFNY